MTSVTQMVMILAPVLVLCFGSLFFLMQSVRTKKTAPQTVYHLLFLFLGASIGGCFLGSQNHSLILQDTHATGGMIFCSQVLVLVLGLIVSIFMYEGSRKDFFFRPQIAAIFLMSLLGMYTFLSANDWITFIVSLEVASIGLYTLVGYTHFNQDSMEGAIKYFILGALATATILFGIGLLYASSGSLQFLTYERIFEQQHLWHVPWVGVGLLFVLVGLLFKLAAVPFHSWSPDAYEAAPTGITAFMATAVKVLILTFFMKLALVFGGHPVWIKLLSVAAVLSMILGNIMALVQTSVKRTLAYSSIAHTGYILLALACAKNIGPLTALVNVYFYLMGYVISTLVAFGTLILLESKTHNNLQLNDLKGLAAKYPWAAFCLTVSLFSFSGMPPTVGFLAKLFVFQTALGDGNYILVIIAALTSAVSLFYYLRIAVNMYMQPASEQQSPIAYFKTPLSVTIISLMTLGVLAFGTMLPQKLLSHIKQKIVVQHTSQLP